MGNTTKYFARHNGVPQNPSTRYARHSGSWQAVLGRWAKHGGAWQLTYSTPSVSCSNVSGTASGASASGTATSSATAPSVGGYASGSYSYAWAYVSGTVLSCSNASASNPTFSYGFSGVASASSSSVSAVYQLTVTDLSSGATSSCQITVSLTWNNTTPAFGAFTASSSGYSGSGANGAGPGNTVSEPWSGTIAAITTSGGPTSGSFSYGAPTRVSGSTDISCTGGSGTSTPTFSGSFFIPPQETLTDSASFSVLVTDTVSGFTATATFTVQFTFTNNTG